LFAPYRRGKSLFSASPDKKRSRLRWIYSHALAVGSLVAKTRRPLRIAVLRGDRVAPSFIVHSSFSFFSHHPSEWDIDGYI